MAVFRESGLYCKTAGLEPIRNFWNEARLKQELAKKIKIASQMKFGRQEAYLVAIFMD